MPAIRQPHFGAMHVLSGEAFKAYRKFLSAASFHAFQDRPEDSRTVEDFQTTRTYRRGSYDDAATTYMYVLTKDELYLNSLGQEARPEEHFFQAESAHSKYMVIVNNNKTPDLEAYKRNPEEMDTLKAAIFRGEKPLQGLAPGSVINYVSAAP